MIRSNSAENHRGEAEAWRRKVSFEDVREIRELESTESIKQEEIWRLPAEIRKVHQALEDALNDELKSRDSSLERGLHNLVVPVCEEDVGSIISYALLNSQVHEVME